MYADIKRFEYFDELHFLSLWNFLKNLFIIFLFQDSLFIYINNSCYEAGTIFSLVELLSCF